MTILQLTVANHPGTMSQIMGLFTRRCFHVDGILCLPLEDSAYSRIWLRIREEKRLEQMIRQLEKLTDVFEIQQHPAHHEISHDMERFFSSAFTKT